MPRFFAFFISLCLLLNAPVSAMDDVLTFQVPGSHYSATREALIEAIEAEGLVVGAIMPFNDMLMRTGEKGVATPFGEAEIFQFCSSGLAWQLVLEAAEQLAICPMSIAIYARSGSTGVSLSYRSPGEATLGRRKAAELLRRITTRTIELARLRW